MPRTRNLVLALLACSFIASPALADSRPNAGAVALDVFLVRPMSMVMATVSTSVFIGLLPITAPTGVSHDAGYWMMAAPWRFTAGRPMGDFVNYQDGNDIRGFAKEWPGETRRKKRARAMQR
jgi:hypothetical protein